MFVLAGEGEAEAGGSVALRFSEFTRDDALRAGEDMTCLETLWVDGSADVEDAWVEIDFLVTRLFGDGVSAKAYCSRAPLKVSNGTCSTARAVFRDCINRNKPSPTDIYEVSHSRKVNQSAIQWDQRCRGSRGLALIDHRVKVARLRV